MADEENNTGEDPRKLYDETATALTRVISVLERHHTTIFEGIGSLLTEDEKILADAGELVRAIKEVRARLNVPLIDAKVMVERYKDRKDGDFNSPVAGDEELLSKVKELNEIVSGIPVHRLFALDREVANRLYQIRRWTT